MFNNYEVLQANQHMTHRGNVDDWLYGEENVIPFTIFASDEDIPQEGEIASIAMENLEPCLYLLEIADDPSHLIHFNGDRFMGPHD